MLNPAMVGFILKGKLDEILAGNIPDGIKVKTKTDQRIVLIPDDLSGFAEGLEFKEISVCVEYKGVLIQLRNE